VAVHLYISRINISKETLQYVDDWIHRKICSWPNAIKRLYTKLIKHMHSKYISLPTLHRLEWKQDLILSLTYRKKLIEKRELIKDDQQNSLIEINHKKIDQILDTNDLVKRNIFLFIIVKINSLW